MKNIIFEINGGIGKNIIATAVCAGIKKQYPSTKLIVITGYPEIFLNNPNVYRVFKFGYCPYFYEDYIKGKDVEFFNSDPYHAKGYILREKHIIETWLECFHLPFNKETPEMFFTSAEKENILTKITSSKPLLLFQPFGGGVSDYRYNWVRDIPPRVAQILANKLCDTFDICHIKHKNHLVLQNTTPLTDWAIRELILLFTRSSKRLLIDSFGQHAAALFSLPSTVCWVGLTPEVIGYNLHHNILPNFPNKPSHLIDEMYTESCFSSPRLYSCPYEKSEDIFNVDQIIESITKNFN